MKDLNFNFRPPVLSKERTREILKNHHSNIVSCIRIAMDSWLSLGDVAPQERKPLRATTQANYMYDHIVDTAKRLFEGVPEVIISEQTGFLVLCFEGVLDLRFKKFDKQLKSGNIPTTQTVEWMTQISIDGYEKTHVVCGYCLDEFQSEITGIYIACPFGSRNEWIYEIGDNAEAIIEPGITLPFDDAPQKTTVVRPTITKEEKKKPEVG